MTLFTDPKEIQQGDTVYHEYDGKKAYGVCVGFENNLLIVDYSTELSTEPKIDHFQKGFWIK